MLHARTAEGVRHDLDGLTTGKPSLSPDSFVKIPMAERPLFTCAEMDEMALAFTIALPSASKPVP